MLDKQGPPIPLNSSPLEKQKERFVLPSLSFILINIRNSPIFFIKVL